MDRKSDRKSENSGQVTVMISLLLCAVLLFTLTCAEGVHIYLGKGRATKSAIAAGESVLADYNVFLWEKYHILAFDQCMKTENCQADSYQLQKYLLENLGSKDSHASNLFQYQINEAELSDKIYLTDEDGEVLKQEIVQYMKYQVPQDILATLVDISAVTSKSQEIATVKGQVEESDKKAKESEQTESEKQKSAQSEGESQKNDNKVEVDDRKKNDETSSKEQTKTEKKQEDPRNVLKRALSGGIVELVTGRTDLSKDSFITEGMPSNNKTAASARKEEKEEEISFHKGNFKEAKELTDCLDTQYQPTSLTTDMISEGLVTQYVLTTFSNALQQTKPEDSPFCEMEYIISGKDSDYKNVKNVINRILLIRFPMNFMYAVKDIELTSQAQTLALSIAGASANPAVIEVVKYLLLACVSYGESVIDVRSLYQGRSVAFVKNKSNWNLQLTNIGSVLGMVTKEEEGGMNYEDYLRLLLLTQNDKSVKYARMLDVMQINGKKQEAGFDIYNMVYGFQMHTELMLRPRFQQIGISDNVAGTGITLTIDKYLAY